MRVMEDHARFVLDDPGVVQEAKGCIGAAAPGGGYVLSSSNTIHSGVKLENVQAMLKTAKKYGRYEP